MTLDNSGPTEASFSQAKIANEVIKVEKSKHQLQQLKASIIDREQSIHRTITLISNARAQWKHWPERRITTIAKRLNVPQSQLESLLQPSIDHHLNELGEISVRLD